MNAACDGGGNRHLSNINLHSSEIDPRLREMYPDHEQIPAGVCSLQLQPDATPWIVCPRRLLALGKEPPDTRKFQRELERQTIQYFQYPSGTRLGVWSEVKIKYTQTDGDNPPATFDYTFDYVLMPLQPVALVDAALDLGKKTTPKALERLARHLRNKGYDITENDDGLTVEGFPTSNPGIIEIMTSSTSGGNKAKGTTISKSFENALLGKPHRAPGINYRQVWARMASQLLVKSEVTLGWGGKTIWILQDVLVNYISGATALDIKKFLAEQTAEVNILSFSYADTHIDHDAGIIELPKVELFAGPIAPPQPASASAEPPPSFQDIIRIGVQPPIKSLISRLVDKPMASEIIVP
jgi:hypothetical protein